MTKPTTTEKLNRIKSEINKCYLHKSQTSCDVMRELLKREFRLEKQLKYESR